MIVLVKRITNYLEPDCCKLMRDRVVFSLLLASLFFLASCTGKETPPVEEKPKQEATRPVPPVPVLNADSAYAFVKAQVDFGPRIPGTKEHAACAAWLEGKLRSYGMEVTVQKGIAETFDQRKYELKNIIASYLPAKSQRILLCAHWDTRPFADRDEGANKNKKFDGANDGASGVGVLIEIARQLSIAKPDIGVDIILFDLEDYGQPEDSNFPPREESWCLGAQHWANNPHRPGYFARFGILLDMVGSKDAVFPKEGTSVYFAASLTDRVWATAAKLGYGNQFIDIKTGAITDDHLYVNRILGIPTIVIVHYDAQKKDFFGHHHRVTDNMDQIDARTLGMVGQTVLQVVFEESVK
jgi:hypothetical protein